MSFGLDPSGRVRVEPVGVRVWFNVVAAPLLYVSRGQVNAAMPFALQSSDEVHVQVEHNGCRSMAVSVPLEFAAPGVFALWMRGMGQTTVINKDGTVNSPSQPAAKGSVVSIYLTDLGRVAYAGTHAEVALVASMEGFLPVRILMNGEEAELLYAGDAPSLVRGVVQVNARVPRTLSVAGPVELVVESGGILSQQAGVIWIG